MFICNENCNYSVAQQVESTASCLNNFFMLFGFFVFCLFVFISLASYSLIWKDGGWVSISPVSPKWEWPHPVPGFKDESERAWGNASGLLPGWGGCSRMPAASVASSPSFPSPGTITILIVFQVSDHERNWGKTEKQKSISPPGWLDRWEVPSNFLEEIWGSVHLSISAWGLLRESVFSLFSQQPRMPRSLC